MIRKEKEMGFARENIKRLLEAGVHRGHLKSRWHPKTAPYLLGSREGIHVINLKKSVSLLTRSLSLLSQILREGGKILIVGNRQENALFTQALGRSYGDQIAFINSKWVGGTITNRNVFRESQGSPKARKSFRAYLQGYPKGFHDPDLLILLNNDPAIVEESYQLRIPCMAILDSTADPRKISYPIPGNDDGVSVQFFYTQLFSYLIGKNLEIKEKNGTT